MSAMWNEIKKINGSKMALAPSGVGEVVLLPVPGLPVIPTPSCWMVASYNRLTKLATELRTDEALQKFIAEQGVRFGLRETDRPPAFVDRQPRFGATRSGPKAGENFGSQRVLTLAQPVKSAEPIPGNRRGDREENVRLYWMTQTAQSHHVVEFNSLRDIGISKDGAAGPMDHGQLPCVLLAAEFHQAYISSILKPEHGRDANYLEQNLGKIYKRLYRGKCAPLSPLWDVSQAILRAAGVAVA